MKNIYMQVALAAVLFLGLNPAVFAGSLEENISNELKRFNIQTAGEFKQHEETLPKDLTAGANWGVKVPVCKAAGYDIEAYAGEKVLINTSSIIEPHTDSKHLRVHVVTKGDEIVCVYKTNAKVIPGVYPVTENSDGARGASEAYETQQGVIIPCEICIVLYPDRFRSEPELCPVCHGERTHFQPAQMMTKEMSDAKAARIDAAIKHIYDTTKFDDPKSDGFPHKYEEIRDLQKKRLIHALVYNELEVEVIVKKIHELDKIIGSPIGGE